MDNPQDVTKILIVDDNKLMRVLLAAIFRSEGYEVVGELSSGLNLLKTIDRLEPDILCLDHEMPGKDGLELFAQIKEANAEIVVVMLTGSQDSAVQEKAITAGVAGFLTKPFSQLQIISQIKQIDHARKLLKTSKKLPKSSHNDIKIVLADDSKLMRSLLRAIVKSMGIFIVGEAQNGQEAVDLVQEHQPQAICLDLEMPVMDGLEALEKIKSTNPAVKVIIVSGNTERDKVRRAIELGANGYIIKPYETNQVLQTLKKILIH